jgi:hypothetical protein
MATMRFPQPSLGDKLLALLGKRRAVRIPPLDASLGPYVSAVFQRERFWRALVRGRESSPPEGWAYPEDLRGGE